MLRLATIGIIALILVIGFSAGYFASTSFSGNTILVKGVEPEPSLGQNTKEAGNIEKHSPEVDKCKNIVCKSSTLVCENGTKTECKNNCNEGDCTNCKPDCSGYENPSNSPNQSPAKAVELTKPSICEPNWSCSNWSLCSGNRLTRKCADSSNCGADQTKPVETQNCEAGDNKSLTLTISTNNQTIPRGTEATISVKVVDRENPIQNSGVEITLTYASGTKQKTSGLTDQSGIFSWTKLIGGNSKIGTFKADAKANMTGYSDASSSITFEIVNKTG